MCKFKTPTSSTETLERFFASNNRYSSLYSCSFTYYTTSSCGYYQSKLCLCTLSNASTAAISSVFTFLGHFSLGVNYNSLAYLLANYSPLSSVAMLELRSAVNSVHVVVRIETQVGKEETLCRR
jgi:hypothetical protein